MIEIPKKINLFKTICFRLKYVANHTSNRNMFGVLIYKKVVLEISRSARVILNNGRFEIGKHWNQKSVFPSLLCMGKDAKLIVNGSFSIFDQCSVYVNEGATLELGSGYINIKSSISCFEKISIGDNVVISEGVTIRDSDNHTLVGSSRPKTQKIEIKNNVWIGINVTILKGVTIGEGSVIAAGAVITKDVAPYTLVGGVPAKILKTSIEWIR